MFVDYLNNLPYCLIGAIGSVLVAKNLVDESFKKNFWYDVIVIIVYALISSIIYSETYSPLQTLLEGLILTLSIKVLFDYSVLSSFMLTIVSLLILLVADFILSINFMFMDNILLIRSNPIIFLFTNIITTTISYLISKINFLHKIIKPFINKFKNKKIKGELLFLILTICIISIFNYQIFSNRHIDSFNINFILFIFMLIVFSLIYIWNKSRYKELENKYNILFDYACSYEEELEKDKLIRHEYKNQLAVIKGLTQNKKILNYIDSILENNRTEESISINGINNLPKGGLRGLFYYKLSIIKKRNIKFSLDISKSVKRPLSQLTVDETKILTYILGIFCDNAIEECIKDSNANISIEVYKIGNELNIVVSNTVIDKININKIGQKGYSTKGQNHGNGIYLIKRILRNSEKITFDTKLINNYFVQQLKIKNI